MIISLSLTFTFSNLLNLTVCKISYIPDHPQTMNSSQVTSSVYGGTLFLGGPPETQKYSVERTLTYVV